MAVSKVLVVYFEDTEVDKKICILDQFMIDEHYQVPGCGKMAVEIYGELGFVRSPEKDDEDELVMEYSL